MVKIDRLIFGYRKIKVSNENRTHAATLLLQFKIESEFTTDGYIIVRERDAQKTKRILSEKIEFDITETLGFLGAYKRIRNRTTVWVTSLVMLFFLIFLSNLVWDIRISGNETLTDARILVELSENGFSVGKLWSKCNKSEIETKMLMTLDEIGWININRRGSVAYVEVIENKDLSDNEQENKRKYSNIVASSDCVIEEITVISGSAVVKPGDVVKKGDLLISGVTEADAGVCRASGTVKGRISEKITVVTDREHFEKTDNSEKLFSVTINLFNFSINILKKYGNLTSECDIIDDVKEYSLFGLGKLPFSITREYIKCYSTEKHSYTDREIVDITSKRLTSAVHSRLISSELLKIKTFGYHTRDGYSMTSELVFISEIGEEVEIYVRD